jgi:hypothetical protein
MVTADAGKDGEKEQSSIEITLGLQAGTTTLEINLAVPQKFGISSIVLSYNTAANAGRTNA